MGKMFYATFSGINFYLNKFRRRVRIKRFFENAFSRDQLKPY